MILWKIAMRNVRQHRSKTLIIGSIIALGILFLVVGNSLMDTAQRGIEKMYIENYTGDLFLHMPSEKQLTLFGAMGPDMGDISIDGMKGYEKITGYLDSSGKVEAYSPQIVGFGLLAYVDEGGEQKGRGFTLVWGVDPEEYLRMFPDNIDTLDGTFISGDKPEIFLSAEAARSLEEETGIPVVPGDTVLITSMTGTAGTKIREVTVSGIFSFFESNVQLDMVSFVDPVTAMALSGLSVSKVTEANLSESERAMLGEVEEDDLFSSDLFSKPVTAEGEQDLTALFDDQTLEDPEGARTGNSWHYILVSLEDGVNTDRFVQGITTFAEGEGIPLAVSLWRDGAGMTADMSFGIQTLFNIIILIIAVVAVIIIMNTLVISVTERIPEIGTIRAVGGQKSFVRGMIIWETLIVSGIFGLIGIAGGTLILGILNATGIEASNMFLRIIFGGKILRPVVSLQAIGTSLIVILAIGVISSLYPTMIALKIKPVQAMSRR